MLKNTPPTGSRIFDEKKSNNSKSVMPKILNSLITLNDNEQSTQSTMQMPVLSIVAERRFIFSSSIKHTIQVSLIDMVEVSEAKNSNTKNASDHI